MLPEDIRPEEIRDIDRFVKEVESEKKLRMGDRSTVDDGFTVTFKDIDTDTKFTAKKMA